MAYLVDTDWLIDLLADRADALNRFEEWARAGIAISIVTYMEAYQGVLRDRAPGEAERRLDALLEGIRILPLSLPVARRCASIRETLKRERKRVNQRALDLIIAATAIEHDLVLLTRNQTDYRDIPAL